MNLAYDSEGDGPLVVLLHGFPQSRRTWKESLPILARAGYRAVAPDLRGYGDSPKPKGIDAYQASEFVADVAALIESLSKEPAIVVGHDWGAIAAWYLAMARPELVRKLVILNVRIPPRSRASSHAARNSSSSSPINCSSDCPCCPNSSCGWWDASASATSYGTGR